MTRTLDLRAGCGDPDRAFEGDCDRLEADLGHGDAVDQSLQGALTWVLRSPSARQRASWGEMPEHHAGLGCRTMEP